MKRVQSPSVNGLDVQIGGSNATVGSTFSQRDVNNGHVVYIHDDSDVANDSVIYGLGLIYGSQLELGTPPPSSWYFSHIEVLPVVIEQVLSFQGKLFKLVRWPTPLRVVTP